jgi:hypothetical protein
MAYWISERFSTRVEFPGFLELVLRDGTKGTDLPERITASDSEVRIILARTNSSQNGGPPGQALERKLLPQCLTEDKSICPPDQNYDYWP